MAESAVVTYLKPLFPKVERRALSGNQDKGDIAGFPGTLEIKNCVKFEPSKWVEEVKVEAKNANQWPPIVVAKRKGRGSPGQWFAIMEFHEIVQLIFEYEEMKAILKSKEANGNR